MITDEIVCAMEIMIMLCKDKEEVIGMEKMLTMLLDFDIDKWNKSSLKENDSFIKKYL